MRLTIIDIVLIILSFICLLVLVFQGIILYKLSKSVNAKGEPLVDPSTIDESLKGTSIFERIKLRYYAEPQKFLKVYFIIMFIIPVLAIPGINTLYTKYLEEPYVKINAPAAGQTVDTVFNITGDFKNVKQYEEIIWIALESENKYFLHTKSANLNYETKKWECEEINRGGRITKGKTIKILALHIEKRLNVYEDIIDNISRDNGKPLDRLPDGCRIMDEKTVTIK